MPSPPKKPIFSWPRSALQGRAFFTQDAVRDEIYGTAKSSSSPMVTTLIRASRSSATLLLSCVQARQQDCVGFQGQAFLQVRCQGARSLHGNSLLASRRTHSLKRKPVASSQGAYAGENHH
jgi:hypothetical protein